MNPTKEGDDPDNFAAMGKNLSWQSKDVCSAGARESIQMSLSYFP